MRIGLYTLFLSPGQIGGIETYLRHLVMALGQVDQVNEYILFIGEHNQDLFQDITYPNLKRVKLSFVPAYNPLPIRVLRRLKIIPPYIIKALNAHPVDLLHYPGTTIDQLEIETPCVLTMHDIQQEYFPEFFSKKVLTWRKDTFEPSAQKARRIITDSEFTRQTIIEKFNISPQKVKAIHFGVSSIFRPITNQNFILKARQKYRLPEKFIFFPANPWPHKNHARLFESIKLLKQRYHTSCRLVLSGVFESEQAQLQSLIMRAGVSDDVHILGYVPYEDMPSIYAAATALIFPSLFEGFGIPILEAMACGCPIICSNTTSLPEIASDAALYIDPRDAAQIAEAIYNILCFQSLRSSLSEKGLVQVKNFSWERAAQQTVELYRNAL